LTPVVIYDIISSMLKKRFLTLNHTLCHKLDHIWPYPLATSFWDSYVTGAAGLADNAEPPKIVDIGAGRVTPYAAIIQSDARELIGVDLLLEDLEANRALTQRIVRDIISDGIPQEAQNVGLITSRMVLEHVPDLYRFAHEVHHALAPGGQTIHLFAGRYSLFAIINRLLPESASRRILFALRPESMEVGGFPTFYDRTNAKAAESVFRHVGMIDVETDVSYQISQYFYFFFPLFVLARLWETVLHSFRLRNLGSFVLLTARRPEQG
jgi:SAM-dependent methyltransferase